MLGLSQKQWLDGETWLSITRCLSGFSRFNSFLFSLPPFACAKCSTIMGQTTNVFAVAYVDAPPFHLSRQKTLALTCRAARSPDRFLFIKPATFVSQASLDRKESRYGITNVGFCVCVCESRGQIYTQGPEYKFGLLVLCCIGSGQVGS